jgi:recombination protein RecA
MPKESKTNLEEAIAQIHKLYGAGSLRKLSDHTAAEPVKVVSCGCLAIDEITGIGGIPRGRIVEVYGPESGGKTTFALQVIAEVQKLGGIAAFIDAEHSLNMTYAASLGVNVDEILMSQPDCGEDALEIAETLIRSGGVSVVVVDSVAALVPRAELEGDMGDAQMGLQARLMSQAMRKLNGTVMHTDTILLFINQTRDKLGVMFGNPETTTGGKALKFYASMRIAIRRIGQIKKGDEIVGADTKVEIVKNKLSSPYRKVEVPLMYGHGFINPERKK